MSSISLLLLLTLPAYLLATEEPLKSYPTTWTFLAEAFFKDRDEYTRTSTSILQTIKKHIPDTEDLSIENIHDKYKFLNTETDTFEEEKQHGVERIVSSIILDPHFDPIDLMLLLDEPSYGSQISDQLYNLALVKLCLFFNAYIDCLSYSQDLLLEQFGDTCVKNKYKEPFDFLITRINAKDKTFLKNKKCYNLIMNYCYVYFQDLSLLISNAFNYHLSKPLKDHDSPTQPGFARLIRAKVLLLYDHHEKDIDTIMRDLIFCVEKGEDHEKVDAIFLWIKHGMRHKDNNYFTFFVKAAARILSEAKTKNTNFYNKVALLLNNIFKSYYLKPFKSLPNQYIAALVEELLNSSNPEQNQRAQLYKLFLYKKGLHEFEDIPDMSSLHEFDLPTNDPLYAFLWLMKSTEATSPEVILDCLHKVMRSQYATLNDLVTILESKHRELSTVSIQLKQLNLNRDIKNMSRRNNTPENQFLANICRAYLKFIHGNLSHGLKILHEEENLVRSIKDKRGRRTLKKSTKKQLEFKVRYLENELIKWQ